MRTRNLLLASLLVALYGCQPETPAQKPAAPASETAAAPAPVEPAAPAAMTPAPASAPVKAAAPAPAEKSAPVAQEKSAAVKKEAAAKPATPAPAATAPASVAPAAKVEPVPAPAVVKPEAVAVVSEADGLALAKKNNCMACHAIDKKVVGPAWKDVAAKYRGDAGAEARLMDKIAKGGSGVWGSMAMPANPKISEADRRALARFVLSLK